MSDECRTDGSLHSFSAFAFEGFLEELIALVKGPVLPLAQLRRRIGEINLNNKPFTPKKEGFGTVLNRTVTKMHFALSPMGRCCHLLVAGGQSYCRGVQTLFRPHSFVTCNPVSTVRFFLSFSDSVHVSLLFLFSFAEINPAKVRNANFHFVYVKLFLTQFSVVTSARNVHHMFIRQRVDNQSR